MNKMEAHGLVESLVSGRGRFWIESPRSESRLPISYKHAHTHEHTRTHARTHTTPPTPTPTTTPNTQQHSGLGECKDFQLERADSQLSRTGRGPAPTHRWLMARQPRGPLPLPDQVAISSWISKYSDWGFSLCCISFVSPTHSHPLALYLLTLQAYPALFIFRTSKGWNKTFLLFSCAHDWKNQNHKDSYDHNDLNGYATNNSK